MTVARIILISRSKDIATIILNKPRVSSHRVHVIPTSLSMIVCANKTQYPSCVFTSSVRSETRVDRHKCRATQSRPSCESDSSGQLLYICRRKRKRSALQRNTVYDTRGFQCAFSCQRALPCAISKRNSQSRVIAADDLFGVFAQTSFPREFTLHPTNSSLNSCRPRSKRNQRPKLKFRLK